MVIPVHKLTNPYCFNNWQWCKQTILRVCVTQHTSTRGMHLVVFTRESLCVNLPRAPFYTRTTYCHLRRGNCQQKSWQDQSKWRMTAIENSLIETTCTFERVFLFHRKSPLTFVLIYLNIWYKQYVIINYISKNAHQS